MIMIKNIFKIAILALALASVYLIGYSIYVSSSERPYDCKVVETYFEDAGYRVSANYIAVVYIIELKKTTYIELTPENYYNATKYKETGETVGYYFSKREINDISGGRDYTDPMGYFLITFPAACILSLIYLSIYHRKDMNL